MYWLPLVLLAVIVAYPAWKRYLGAPLAVREKVSIPMHSPLFVAADAATVPERFRDVLERGAAALEAAGFERVAVAAGNHAVWGIVLVSREFGDVATVAAAEGIDSISVGRLVAGGPCLVTSNGRQASTFDATPVQRDLALPQVTDPAWLVALHRARVAREAPGATALLPAPGDEVRAIGRVAEEVMAHRVGTGWLVPRGDAYRLTLKAAYLTSWRLSWPLRGMRARRVRRAGIAAEARLAPLADRPAAAKVAYAPPLPPPAPWETELRPWAASRGMPERSAALKRLGAGEPRRAGLSLLATAPVYAASAWLAGTGTVAGEIVAVFAPMWAYALVQTWLQGRDIRRAGLACATCGRPLRDRKGVFLLDGPCPHCGAADATGSMRPAAA